ncbi:MAG: peptide chain release factor 1 [Elusimicrobia bacterium]|nr:peptide chain release factor 1 [Candidatus Liberimonas magnetica]
MGLKRAKTMIEQKLELVNKRFLELETLLSDPAVMAQGDNYRNYLKEHSRLSLVVAKYAQYKQLKKDIENLSELKESNDPEMKAMAITEGEELLKKKESLEQEIKLFLVPPDPNDDKNIIVEIRAGTGGEEAALFCGDMFRMYTRYAEIKGWKVELMDSHPTGLGGYKEVIFSINGKNVWKYFKYERGIHRVQRVPETEASGRIHTSAISVAVLPEAEEVDIEVKPEDLRIDTYRASGAGGQHVNKTESAIRITHIPTNLVITCQDERSQMKNRAKAMKILRSKLLEQKQIAHEKEIKSDRKKQVGSGDRSEKIRTYNFPQNRITDHRINFSLYRLEKVLEGDLDELIEQLMKADNEEKLNSFEA